MRSPDLDNSMAVHLLTGVLYVGWLCILSGFVVLVGIEPLPTIQAWWPGLPGQVAAVAAGAAFIGVSKQLYDYLRARWKSPAKEPAKAEPHPPTESEVVPEKGKKRKKKKKKKKRT